MADVGLLRQLSLLSPSAFTEGNRLFVAFKGALTENYVLEALKNQFEATPRYWTMENPRYEVDFLIQRDFMADYTDKLIGLSLKSSNRTNI